MLISALSKVYSAALKAFFLCSSTLALSLIPADHTMADIRFVTQDFPPFSYADSAGKISGPFADLARHICKVKQLQCTFDILPWSRAQAYLKGGLAEAIFPFGINKQRQEWVTFSIPVVETAYGFFLRKNKPVTLKNSDELEGKTIGVYGPSNTATVLNEFNIDQQRFKVMMTPDDQQLFKMLFIDRVDAVFSNRDVGIAMLQRLQKQAYHYSGNYVQIGYYFGFPKHRTSKDVLIFMQTLAQMKQNKRVSGFFCTSQNIDLFGCR
ncbi:MAG: transporter substrate-binding domain-containing protein [Motiliproteus sp.]